VTFMDGNVVLATVPVNLVQGSTALSATSFFTTSFAAAGNHAITAVYNGNATLQASTSQALTEQLNPPPPTHATTTTIPSPLPPAIRQPITLRASVPSPAGTPTGTVTFLDGNTVLGTAQVNAAGQASLTVSLGVGNHALTASFAGTGNFANSTSAAVAQTVSPASTSVALASAANPAVRVQAGAFLATVPA